MAAHGPLDIHIQELEQQELFISNMMAMEEGRIKMPIPQAVHSAVTKPVGCTNCPPHFQLVKNGMVGIGWSPSASHNIVTQQLWATFVLPPQWFFVEGFSNWVTNAAVSVTNYAQEYFGVRVGNSNCWSRLPGQ